MSHKKVWFITGAGRGMGLDFTKAALKAGHAVVATGRNPEVVSKAIGISTDDLLVIKLDITSELDAEKAVKQAVAKFGRIDVLVNNAANFYAGFFEEQSIVDIEKQIKTNLIGPMIVTKAILPQMRKQRDGLIVAISSAAGVVGHEFCSAYAASKFGLEGWIESLQAEVSSFGIQTLLVNPGFFRSELLTEQSTIYSEPSISDYAEKTKKTIEIWKSISGKQPGNPAKLAAALIAITSEKVLPRRFVAGGDAVEGIVKKAEALKAEALAFADLSSDMNFD